MSYTPRPNGTNYNTKGLAGQGPGLWKKMAWSVAAKCLRGATTLGITTLMITTFSIMTFKIIMNTPGYWKSIATLSVISAECHTCALYAECHHAEWCYADCHLCWVSHMCPLCWVSLCWMSLCWASFVLSVTHVPFMLSVICAECHKCALYAEFHYAECPYAECH